MGEFYGGVYGRQTKSGFKQKSSKLIELLAKHGYPTDAIKKILMEEDADNTAHNYRGVLRARKQTIKNLGYTQKGKPIKQRVRRAGIPEGLAKYNAWKKKYIADFIVLNDVKPTRAEISRAWASEKGTSGGYYAGEGVKRRRRTRRVAGEGVKRRRTCRVAGEGVKRRRTRRVAGVVCRRIPRRGGMIAGEGFYG